MENNKYRDFKGQTWTKFNDAIKGKKLFLYGYGEIGKNILENIHKYDSKWPIVGVIDKAEAEQEMGETV